MDANERLDRPVYILNGDARSQGFADTSAEQARLPTAMVSSITEIPPRHPEPIPDMAWTVAMGSHRRTKIIKASVSVRFMKDSDRIRQGAI